MRKCAFCEFRYQKGSDISFHRFPTDLAARQIWLQNMKAGNWKPREKDVLCSKHFDVTCVIKHHSRRSLKDGSVPTIFERNFEVTESCKGLEDIEEVTIKIEIDVEEPQPSTSLYPSKYAIYTRKITESLAKNPSSSSPSCESPNYYCRDYERSVPIIEDNAQKDSSATAGWKKDHDYATPQTPKKSRTQYSVAHEHHYENTHISPKKAVRPGKRKKA